MAAKIYLIRGSVRITEDAKRKQFKVAPFEGGICTGCDDASVRATFKWWRTQKDRIKAKAIEDAGKVELIDYEIIRPLGLNI